jgi:hypothetical protein
MVHGIQWCCWSNNWLEAATSSVPTDRSSCGDGRGLGKGLDSRRWSLAIRDGYAVNAAGSHWLYLGPSSDAPRRTVAQMKGTQ